MPTLKILGLVICFLALTKTKGVFSANMYYCYRCGNNSLITYILFVSKAQASSRQSKAIFYKTAGVLNSTLRLLFCACYSWGFYRFSRLPLFFSWALKITIALGNGAEFFWSSNLSRPFIKRISLALMQ